MMKVIFVVLAITSLVMSHPAAQPEAKPGSFVAAPLVAAPAVVAAQSSQVIARNYNALATPVVAARAVAPVAAPLVASPYLSSYATAPYLSPYVASPYYGNAVLL